MISTKETEEDILDYWILLARNVTSIFVSTKKMGQGI